MTGAFFSFDGVDGVGKTTQMHAFCRWLEEQGHEVVTCRDPGGTKLGEAVRELVLHKTELAVSPLAEMLLYMTSRAQLVSEVIQPALAAGKTVVSDRFLLSNVAYQGYGGGLDVACVWEVGRVATGGLSPTLTLLLDMSAEQAAKRLNRQLDRMEARGLSFLQRVRDGFLAEARRSPQTIVVVNADQPVEAVQSEIRSAALRALTKES